MKPEPRNIASVKSNAIARPTTTMTPMTKSTSAQRSSVPRPSTRKPIGVREVTLPKQIKEVSNFVQPPEGEDTNMHACLGG
jgi:hypothetical protein